MKAFSHILVTGVLQSLLVLKLFLSCFVTISNRHLSISDLVGKHFPPFYFPAFGRIPKGRHKVQAEKFEHGFLCFPPQNTESLHYKFRLAF